MSNAFTRQHFELVANVLRGNGQSNPEAGPVSWALQKKFDSICSQFADAFVLQNPRFDRRRFLEACGATAEEKTPA